MRNFRNAALAAATATAVAFGGTAVATAQEAPKPASSSTTGFRNDGKDATRAELLKKLGGPNPFFQVGFATNAGEPATVNQFSSDPQSMPQWARIWREAVNILAIATGIGLIIGAGNAALNRGLLPQIPW